MIDFRPKTRARNYLARGEQYRLLGLVFAVGLVVFLIKSAANPQNLSWFWQAAGQVGDLPAGSQAAAAVEQPPDLKRRLTGEHEFIAEADRKEPLPANKRFFPGVDRELLSKVRDDTMFRPSEAAAFYHLLALLKESPAEAIERGSSGTVSFTQLFTQPKEFRGDLVTIEGTVLRAMPKKAAKNDYGVDQFYMLVMAPTDRAYGVVIYTVELPQGFPRGERIREPVTITGFFYKRWAHLSEDNEIMTWPMLLSKKVRRRPAATAPPPRNPQAEMRILAWGVAGVLFASLLIVGFVVATTRRKPRVGMPASLPGELRLQAGARAADVRERLGELAKEEQP